MQGVSGVWVDDKGVGDDVVALRNVVLSAGVGIIEHGKGGIAYLLLGAAFYDDDIVRHDVLVDQFQRDRLACFH